MIGKTILKDKASVFAGVGIALLVAILFGLYLGGYETSDVIMLVILVVVIGGAMFLIRDRIKNLRSGLPNADERVKKLHWKAGAYTYYATIWIAIGTMWYNIIFADNLGFEPLDAGQVVAVVVLLSAMVWFSLQVYFMKKGDVE